MCRPVPKKNTEGIRNDALHERKTLNWSEKNFIYLKTFVTLYFIYGSFAAF